MEEYIQKLNQLLENFSYQEFTSLLEEIDNKILNRNISMLDSRFLQQFNRIMNFTNDQYEVDGEKITLGSKLIEDCLINKQKLPPTLMAYFYSKQKELVGAGSNCNNIHFCNERYKMAICNEPGRESFLGISLKQYEIDDVDTFNYNIMHDLTHEVTHVYQDNCLEDSNNPFERLTFYDKKRADIVIESLLGGDSGGNAVIHESLISEFMADEQADSYMINLMQRHPEYFNSNLIQRVNSNYQEKRNPDKAEVKNFTDPLTDPRRAFDEILIEIKTMYGRVATGGEEAVQQVIDRLEPMKKAAENLVEELMQQGISENPSFSYYNIFLNSTYHVDGKNCIFEGRSIEFDNVGKKSKIDSTTIDNKSSNILSDEKNYVFEDKSIDNNIEKDSKIEQVPSGTESGFMNFKQKIAKLLQKSPTLMRVSFLERFVNNQLNVLSQGTNINDIEQDTQIDSAREEFENWLSNNGELKKLLPLKINSNKKSEDKSKEYNDIDVSL